MCEYTYMYMKDEILESHNIFTYSRGVNTFSPLLLCLFLFFHIKHNIINIIKYCKMFKRSHAIRCLIHLKPNGDIAASLSQQH